MYSYQNVLRLRTLQGCNIQALGFNPENNGHILTIKRISPCMGGTTTALHNERKRKRNRNLIARRTDVIAALVPLLQSEIPVEGLDYPIPEVKTSGLDIALLQSALP